MSYFFVIIFIFAVFWRPQEWLVPALYGWPILDGVVYLSALAMMLEWDSGRLKVDVRRPHLFLFAGLFVAALMSHIANTYFAGLLANWMTAFQICFFGMLLFLNTTSVVRLIWINRIFVFMAGFMAVHGLLQQTRGYGFGGGAPVWGWRVGQTEPVMRSQFFGIFADPNDMAQAMCMAMPLSFAILKRKSLVSLLLGCAISYLLFLGVEATWSRGAYVALAAIAGVACLWIFPPRWFAPLLVCACIMGLLLIPFSAKYLDASAVERINFWGDANFAFKTRPIFGVGLGMIREYITRSRSVHNAYVTCYAELGIFGYFFWFSLLLFSTVVAARVRVALHKESAPDAKWLYRYSGLGLASLLGFAAASYFLSRAFVFPLFFMFATLGALPEVAKQVTDGGVSHTEPTLRDVLIFGVPASIACIAYIYVSILLLNRVR